MSRYIITREQIRGQEYFISALCDDNGKVIEVFPEAVLDAASSDGAHDAVPSDGAHHVAEQPGRIGDIYIGRVENVVKNLNAAFVKISPTQTCYLDLADLKHPIFTRKISEKKPIAAGEELLVQIIREPLKTKEAAVTTNLNFSGKYAAITTGNRKIAASSKLSKEQRAHFLTLVNESLADTNVDYGVVVRTNAQSATDEAVLADLHRLADACHRVTENAGHKTCYTCLYREEASFLKTLHNLQIRELSGIITDDRDVFEQICASYQIGKEKLMTAGSVSVPVDELVTGDGIRLRYYRDTAVSLAKVYSLATAIEEALKERVWLKSGAYLIIQPTEALTVIDVNTGKNVAKKESQENFLRVNMEAATEIARQLRLRNLSGIIVVDFMNLTAAEANETLLSHFRRELKSDPVQTQLVDMTKLGLVEVTRKKVRKPLGEIIQ